MHTVTQLTQHAARYALPKAQVVVGQVTMVGRRHENGEVSYAAKWIDGLSPPTAAALYEDDRGQPYI